jgi:hypothetical protein
MEADSYRNRGAGPKRTMKTIRENTRTKRMTYVRREPIAMALRREDEESFPVPLETRRHQRGVRVGLKDRFERTWVQGFG